MLLISFTNLQPEKKNWNKTENLEDIGRYIRSVHRTSAATLKAFHRYPFTRKKN